jgi:Ca2+/Na+ antiporter
MTERIDKANNTIKGIAAIIALFPGIAVLLRLVEIPPSLADLVKVISFSISGVVLIAVFLLSDRISRLSREKVALFSIVAVLLGAACSYAYFRFADSHTVVVELPDGSKDKYIVPLSPSAPLLEAVEAWDDSYEKALQLSPDREDLKRSMDRESGPSMLVMILLLVFSELLLVAPVVAAAWRLAAGPQQPTRPRAAKKAPPPA